MRGAACNCSICQKRGALWAFAGPDQFTLHSGDDDLTDYQFAKKMIHHLFCKNCGIGSFSARQGAGRPRLVAINVRCLDDVDIAALKTTPFDGKSL